MYQYESVKLEKGMYHLTNKSFSQALEEADPSAQYANSPLAGLDAYERQLKRFDIHVSGVNCDKVEKFFTTTESAILFPEFIRRAVLQGFEESILSEIVAATSRSQTTNYQGCDLTDTETYAPVTPGTALPVSTISESNTTIILQKYARMVETSYEAIRQQRLDVYAVMLRSIGQKLSNVVTGKAVSVIKSASNNSTKTTVSSENFGYDTLATLFGKFTNYKMRVLLASPANVAKILTMSQMAEITSQDVNEIRLPFGTKLINCPQLDDNTILGLDNIFALEQLQSSDLILETDKIINRQLEGISMSITINFRALISDAMRMLAITT